MAAMRVTRVKAGHYRTSTGHDIIREDVPSLDEWDEPSGEPVWYVLTTAEAERGGALPDARFEAATLRACRAWAASL